MTKTRFKREIQSIRAIVRDFEDANEKIVHLFGRDAKAENVFLEQVYEAVTKAIEYLSELSNDQGEWIHWFAFECDFGRKHMEAVIDGKNIKCRNSADLWEIIQACCYEKKEERYEINAR